MGRLSGELTQATLRKAGQRGLHRQLQAIDQVWAEIRQAIEGLELPGGRVRLYQDGLPVCGRENEIVEELARAGSINHQLLRGLMARGATLMGTESAELLLQEYDLARESLEPPDPRRAGVAARRRQALGQALLQQRDRYIAQRINATLQPGETGIIFLGMLHSPANFLDKDIRVIFPLKGRR